MMTLPKFEQVVKVYSGRPGCCCGCRGRYMYRSEHKQQAEERRGKVNDTAVKKQLEKMGNLIEAGYPVESDTNYFMVDTGDRWFIAYLD